MAGRKNILVLTGAGISAASGLATFRGEAGLWDGHRIEDVCTPDALSKNRKLVHRFYDERRSSLKLVKPNAAHEALAKLERHWTSRNKGDLIAEAGLKFCQAMIEDARDAVARI